MESEMITANAILLWIVQGFFYGVGGGLGLALIGWPLRRFW